MNNIKIALAFTALIFAYPGLVPADDLAEENEHLKLEVETLKQRINELQAKQTGNCAGATTKKTGKGWGALAVGMTKAEVTAIVGKPGRIDKWKTGEAWYYAKDGEVDFGVEEKVTGWLAP